jgi:hypothetical protein
MSLALCLQQSHVKNDQLRNADSHRDFRDWLGAWRYLDKAGWIPHREARTPFRRPNGGQWRGCRRLCSQLFSSCPYSKGTGTGTSLIDSAPQTQNPADPRVRRTNQELSFALDVVRCRRSSFSTWSVVLRKGVHCAFFKSCDNFLRSPSVSRQLVVRSKKGNFPITPFY